MKLAPAADVPPAWAERCELEWIGRGGQCRQLVAWHGELARSPGQRRATVLANDGGVTRTIVGQSERSIPFAAQLDRYLFEPEPAVLAARLAGVVAAEHGLSKFSPGIAYLTGPAAIDDPALACLEVEEVLPLKLKLLTEYLRQRGVGRLEIKKRGVEQDPEQLRRALKLAGDDAATLILAMLNRKRVAIVAKRIDRGEVAAPPNPESRVLNPPHAACL